MRPLFHCFGTGAGRTVDTPTAVQMLKASGCRHLVANTHDVDAVAAGDELRVGYATATVGSVLGAWEGPPLEVVININQPTTAREAVRRARRALALRDEKIVKLEVLDADQALTDDAEVLAAAAELCADPSLEVWPLVTPDPAVAAELEDAGCSLIRVMGSPIGSGAGLDPDWIPGMEEILASTRVPVMLDGGVGGAEHVVQALELGFDCVLANSCLFAGARDPAAELAAMRAAVEFSREPAAGEADRG
jgi:thiazole synthase